MNNNSFKIFFLIKNFLFYFITIFIIISFLYFYFFSKNGMKKIIFYEKILIDKNKEYNELTAEYNYLEETFDRLKTIPKLSEYVLRNKLNLIADNELYFY